jgi:hypothetical protein
LFNHGHGAITADVFLQRNLVLSKIPSQNFHQGFYGKEDERHQNDSGQRHNQLNRLLYRSRRATTLIKQSSFVKGFRVEKEWKKLPVFPYMQMPVPSFRAVKTVASLTLGAQNLLVRASTDFEFTYARGASSAYETIPGVTPTRIKAAAVKYRAFKNIFDDLPNTRAVVGIPNIHTK